MYLSNFHLCEEVLILLPLGLMSPVPPDIFAPVIVRPHVNRLVRGESVISRVRPIEVGIRGVFFHLLCDTDSSAIFGTIAEGRTILVRHSVGGLDPARISLLLPSTLRTAGSKVCRCCSELSFGGRATFLALNLRKLISTLPTNAEAGEIGEKEVSIFFIMDLVVNESQYSIRKLKQ